MKYNPDLHHRHSIRLHNYDYANAGAYFVTICCKNRECLFGRIVSGEMILNEYGKIATQCWHFIPQHFPHTILHEYVVMPNHLHGIIEIKNNAVGVENFQPLQSSEQPPSPAMRPTKNAFQKIIPHSIGSIIRGFKIGTTKQFGYPIWQRNYWERIIRDEIEYARIANYIKHNPISWEKDRFNADRNKAHPPHFV